MNNCKEDGTAYVLTVFHNIDQLDVDVSNEKDCVLDGVEIEDLNHSVFYFEDESACNTTDNYNEKSIIGSSIAFANAEHDYALLKLSSMPPKGYNAYYAGIDASSNNPTKMTVIHHPKNLPKSISVDFDSPTSGSVYGCIKDTSNVWTVQYNDDSTEDNGLAAPGSSGAPYFNQNAKVIGIHGASDVFEPAPCSDKESKFIVSKISKVWDLGLKDELDPDNECNNSISGNSAASILINLGITFNSEESCCNKDEKIYGNKTFNNANDRRVSRKKFIKTTKDKDFVIKNSSSVSWGAGEYIEFNSGVFIEEGSTFIAGIIDCSKCSLIKPRRGAPFNDEYWDTENEKFTHESEKAITIFPNPNNGSYTVQVPYEENLATTISVYNTLGERVYQHQATQPNTTIDISHHPKGLYFTKIQQGENIVVKKVVYQ